MNAKKDLRNHEDTKDFRIEEDLTRFQLEDLTAMYKEAGTRSEKEQDKNFRWIIVGRRSRPHLRRIDIREQKWQ